MSIGSGDEKASYALMVAGSEQTYLEGADLNTPYERSALNGLSRFRYAAKEMPETCIEDQELLFGIIAEDAYQSQDLEGKTTAQLSEVALEALDRIVQSYLSFTIGRAYKVWDRSANTLSLDDLVGAACEGLVVAVKDYAQKEEHNSFPAYLSAVLRTFLANEVASQRYRTNRLSGWEKDTLQKYDRIIQEEPHEANLTSGESRQKISVRLGVCVSDIVAAQTLAMPPLFYDGVGVQGEDNMPFLDTIRSPSIKEVAVSPAKEIILERALALLTPFASELLRKHYDLDGPAYSIKELMELYDLGEAGIRSPINDARRELAVIIPQIEDNSLDLLQWRAENPRRKNVLVFLALVGEAIPSNVYLSELRVAAMKKILGADMSDQRKQVLIDMYGLKNGRPISGSEISRMTSMPLSSVYFHERCALGALGVTLVTKKGGSSHKNQSL